MANNHPPEHLDLTCVIDSMNPIGTPLFNKFVRSKRGGFFDRLNSHILSCSHNLSQHYTYACWHWKLDKIVIYYLVVIIYLNITHMHVGIGN